MRPPITALVAVVAIGLCGRPADAQVLVYDSASYANLLQQAQTGLSQLNTLRNQVTQAGQREAQIEKHYWNSPNQLQVLIHSHQQRIEQLTGNPEAGEIVAHDRDAVTRLEKRIADIEAERQAQAAAQVEQARLAAEQAKQAQAEEVH